MLEFFCTTLYLCMCSAKLEKLSSNLNPFCQIIFGKRNATLYGSNFRHLSAFHKDIDIARVARKEGRTEGRRPLTENERTEVWEGGREGSFTSKSILCGTHACRPRARSGCGSGRRREIFAQNFSVIFKVKPRMKSRRKWLNIPIKM